jgi:hypothetical protein
MEIDSMQDELDYPDPYKDCRPLNHYEVTKKTKQKLFACGCKFENEHSNAIILCDACSKLPCHNKYGAKQ